VQRCALLAAAACSIALACSLLAPSRDAFEGPSALDASILEAAPDAPPSPAWTVIWAQDGGPAPGVTSIASDGTRVFFSVAGTTNGGLIVRTAPDGGDPLVLASAQRTPRYVSLDEANVYFANTQPGGGSVARVPKEGGNVIELKAAPLALGTGRDTAVWSADGDPHVYFVSVGFAPTDDAGVFSTGTSPRGLAVDTTVAFWNDDGGLWRRNVATPGPANLLIADAGDAPEVFAAWGYVAWASRAGTVGTVGLAAQDASTPVSVTSVPAREAHAT
jgi:hypothetical protein